MKKFVRTNLIVLIALLPWVASAETINPGAFTIDPWVVYAIHATAEIQITPTGLTEVGQVLDLMLQESTDGGTTWHDWFGVVLTSGSFIDINGDPQTVIRVHTTPRTTIGTFVRASGTLTSDDPIGLTISVVEIEP